MSWPTRRRPSRARPRPDRNRPPAAGPTAGEDGAEDGATGIRPGTITGLTGQARDPERLNLAIDGQFACGIDRAVAERAGLRVGEELTAEHIATLQAEDETARATNAALTFLAHRARSEREVRDRLRTKGYGPDAIDGALGKLQHWGYLNDAEFARTWTDNRAQHQPRGKRLIAQELRQKGVDRDTVAATLDEAEIDEVADALALARKRFRPPAAGDRAAIQAEQRRLSGFLGRRGYGYDVIRPVLATLFGPAEELDAASGDVDPGD